MSVRRMVPALAGGISRRAVLQGMLGTALAAGMAGRGDDAAACELVEIYPGYPGYRGYVTGVDGVGDHACVEQLRATDPSFSAAVQDSQNDAAAQRIALAGAMDEWTWENWMAIEAERDLPPTCYSCALANAASRPAPSGIAADPNDPRLLMGVYYDPNSFPGTSGARTVARRYLAQRGLPLSGLSSAPLDQDLRALAQMAAPGQHRNAFQIVSMYDEFLDIWFGVVPGKYIPPAPYYQGLIEQGGYAPTTDHAVPDDQVYMVVAGLVALRTTLTDQAASGLLNLVRNQATEWQLARGSNLSTPGFGQWLRDHNAQSWLG